MVTKQDNITIVTKDVVDKILNGQEAFINEEDNKMKTNLQQAIDTINFDENCSVGGEYGVHDGFFNFLVNIDNQHYYVQCCFSDSDNFDVDDSGYDDGICADVNKVLAEKLAEDCSCDISDCFGQIRILISLAYHRYCS